MQTTSLVSRRQVCTEKRPPSFNSLCELSKPPLVRHSAHTVEANLVRLNAVSAGIFVIFTVVAYQANEEYSDINNDHEDFLSDVLRMGAVAISLGHLAVILRIYRLQKRLQVVQERAYGSSFAPVTSRELFSEMFLHCIVLPPRVNYVWRVYMLGTYAYLTASDIAFVIGLFRFYHLLRLYYWNSSFSRSKAYFYCFLESVEKPFAWAWKGALKSRPAPFLLVVWIMIALIGGAVLRTFEHSVPANKLDTLWSAFWAVVVPETTIGYGDIVPLTHLGRLTVIMAVAGGMFVYSSTILLTHSTIDLNEEERELFGALYFRENAKQLTRPAAVLVQRWWAYRCCKVRKRLSLLALAKLNRHVRHFRLQRRQLASKQITQFVREIRKFEANFHRSLSREIDRLSELPVILKASHELNTVEYSIKMKLKSIQTTARSLLLTFTGREVQSTAQTEDMNPRRSMGNSSMKSAKRAFRARDSAFKKLLMVRTAMQVFSSTPSSAASCQASET